MPLTEFRDPADSPRASEGPDYAAIEARDLLACAIRAFPGSLPLARVLFEKLVIEVCAGQVANALAETGGSQNRTAQEVVARIVTEVRAMPNPYLALRCLPIVFGLPCADESETELALEFGLTKGGVSDVAIRLCDRFGVEPGPAMKRLAARGSYSTRQRGKRARPLPSPWPFRGLFRQLRAA